MKKILLGVLVASAMLTSVTTFAESAKLVIRGTIVPSTCDVEPKDGDSLYFSLNDAGTDDFKNTAGTQVGEKDGAIQLKECDVSKVHLKFDSPEYSNSQYTAILLDGGANQATGVGHYLKDGITGDLIDVANGVTSDALLTRNSNPDAVQFEGSVPFKYGYMSLADTVTAGPTQSTVNFVVEYN